MFQTEKYGIMLILGTVAPVWPVITPSLYKIISFLNAINVYCTIVDFRFDETLYQSQILTL